MYPQQPGQVISYQVRQNTDRIKRNLLSTCLQGAEYETGVRSPPGQVQQQEQVKVKAEDVDSMDYTFAPTSKDTSNIDNEYEDGEGEIIYIVHEDNFVNEGVHYEHEKDDIPIIYGTIQQNYEKSPSAVHYGSIQTDYGIKEETPRKESTAYVVDLSYNTINDNYQTPPGILQLHQ